MNLILGDCIERMKEIDSGSIDLVLTDPPYNIGLADWDKIDGYVDWFVTWMQECERVLKPTGVLYFWHNDMEQIAELLHEIRKRTNFRLKSFYIWDKGDSYRPLAWKNRRPDSKTALRSWFNVCEYCVHFGKKEQAGRNKYNPLADWYKSELKRIGITETEIADRYTDITGKKPYMLRHYFKNTQCEIPTRTVWETVYIPLGFGQKYDDIRTSYAELQEACKRIRRTHNMDLRHCNIWHIPPIPSNHRYHTCQKPVEILERLIRVSSNEGETVLDCFMGSASTGVACINTNRHFVGIEKDEKYFDIAKERIEKAQKEKQKILNKFENVVWCLSKQL